jgi:hypothetical protein
MQHDQPSSIWSGVGSPRDQITLICHRHEWRRPSPPCAMSTCTSWLASPGIGEAFFGRAEFCHRAICRPASAHSHRRDVGQEVNAEGPNDGPVRPKRRRRRPRGNRAARRRRWRGGSRLCTRLCCGCEQTRAPGPEHAADLPSPRARRRSPRLSAHRQRHCARPRLGGDTMGSLASAWRNAPAAQAPPSGAGTVKYGRALAKPLLVIRRAAQRIRDDAQRTMT